MEFRKLGILCILACLLLILLPATVAAADYTAHAPLIALDLLQGKPKVQYSFRDFEKAAEDAEKNKDYADAIKNYDKAKELITGGGDKPLTEKDYSDLADIEYEKSGIYSRWPGHEKEMETAIHDRDYYNLQGRKEAERYGGYCLIATATFGSPLAPEVQQLREFRQNNIYSTASGTQFMFAFEAWYYSFSPGVAQFIDDHPSTKPPMRVILTPLLGILTLAKMSFFALSTYPEIAVIVTGFFASTLIGMVYAFPLLFVLLLVIRKVHPFTFTTTVIKIPGGFAVTGFVLLIAGGLIALQPVLLVGSVLFIVSLVFLTGLSLSWACMNRLDSFTARANKE